MIDIYQYHWVWYVLGLACVPRITLMIIVSLYTNLPLWGKILLWIIAVLGDLKQCKDECRTKAGLRGDKHPPK